MNNKKGLSMIVSTLIIILLVLVAVGIIWGVVSNLLRKGADDITISQFFVDLEIERAYLDGGNVMVNVKRNVGEGDIVGMNFVFSNATDSEIQSIDEVLDELEEATYSFTLVDMDPNTITSVSVAPIFNSGETGSTATTGDITDTALIGDYVGGSGGDNPITCTPDTTCAGEGFICGEVDDGCGTILTCGTCDPGESCSVDQLSCEACVNETAADTCSAGPYECGTWQNNCGYDVNCTEVVGCGLEETCNEVSGLCIAPLEANITGAIINSIWPSTIATHFDSDELDVFTAYPNPHYIRITNGTDVNQCYIIWDYHLPDDPINFNLSYIQVGVTSTNLAVGDTFDIWVDFGACQAQG